MMDRAPLPDSKRSLVEEYVRNAPHQQPFLTAPIPRRDLQEPVPLSCEQEQIWLHAQLAPDVPLYNEPLTIRYAGDLNAAALEASFNVILTRHEMWRTSFEIVDGRPVQIIHPRLTISLPVLDLRHLPAQQRESEAVRLATGDARAPFDLTKIPLLRARLIQLDDEDYRLYLTLSHMIFDGIAVYRVLLPELATLYHAFVAGIAPSLPDTPIQYADYAYWQRRMMHTEQLSPHIEYWRRQLAGDMPTLEFPTNAPRSALSTFRGAMCPFALDEELVHELKAFCTREGFTLFQTLLAGFAALLCRYSGLHDIPIGTVTAGRKRPETQTLLGYFINTIVLRIDLSGNPSFTELVSRVRNETLDALDHDVVPFGQLLKELQPQREANHSPLFQVLFSLEVSMPKLDASWDMTQMDIDTGAAKYSLYVQLEEKRERILGRFQYSSDVFDLASIARMVTHWKTMLEGAMADPGGRLYSLPLLSNAEAAQLATWNTTAKPQASATISAMFEAQVRRSPNAIAVVAGDQWLSYRELNARANQLARRLRKLGVGPEVLVGLCVERSLEMVAGLLGILKAGGAYVPLDPALPGERLAMMLSDAKPSAVLTQQAQKTRLPGTTKSIVLDPDWNVFATESVEDLDQAAQPENLAYVMYTSGSTGFPKGVQIEHGSVVNLLCSMQREPGIRCDDILLAVTTISFDIAGLEIYLPLVSGARLVLAGSEVARDGLRLKALIESTKPTIMQATPATWRLLIEAGWKGSPALTILCGGETLSPTLARELVARSRCAWNLYGPTETTIWSSVYRVTGKEDRVPLGRPIANTQIHVLDFYMNPLPVGVSGEIYIGGAGVARGYLNRPELSAERMLPNPLGTGPQGRLYKTGDMGRRLADGNILFIGRTDNQVKIRGFRVELGSIETSLAQHPGVKAVLAILREDKPGDARLIAYVIPRDRRASSAEDFRTFLKRVLPEYMIPAHIVLLDTFPLMPSGKVDRAVLPAPQKTQTVDSRFVPARDDFEKKLTEIWEDVLQIKPIGVQDDFFALGGHSLLAVRLFALIERAFGRSIPLATLLKAATIERLAHILREEQRPDQWFSFVPIQQGGSRPPLFCISSQLGDVLLYRPLSEHLGSDQPFFALQVLGQHGLPRHHAIESMAASYVEAVRKIQPIGPYFLCGYCFGGRVALEMAQQLIAHGENVALLGLFVTYHVRLGSLSDRTRLHLRQFRLMGTRAKLAYLVTNLRNKARSFLWRAKYKLIGGIVGNSSPLFCNVVEMNLHALRRYTAKRYPGRMTVFMSGKVPSGFLCDPEVRLKEYLYDMDADEIDLHVVPGDADTMFQEPFVRVLSEELRNCVELAAASTFRQSSAA